jgi:acetyltransferase
MSTRNLDRLFKPRTVALIGASAREGSVGAVLAGNLLDASGGGFAGDVWLVNPKGRAADGRPAHRSIAALPAAPDLAVVSTPAAAVPDVVAALAARGTRAAIVVSAGFGEGGDAEGERRRLRMLQAGREATMRIVGPNCLGVQVPGIRLNASFAHRPALPGGIGFVSQSGAIITVLIDWALSRRIGFTHVVSLGEMADVDLGDMLDWLAADADTTAILLHIESITDARKFMSAARAAARAKPVVVVKAGRSEAAARAVHAHIGAHAGADAVYDAAFRRAGMLRVEDLDDLLETAATLGAARLPTGERLAILTNGGGLGVLAADALDARAGRLAELSLATRQALALRLPGTWAEGNPVDILGDAPAERYQAALAALLADPGVDAVLVINAPSALADGRTAAKLVIETARPSRKPVLAAWAGSETQQAARALFAAAGLPSYDTPRQAVSGFMRLVQWRRNRELLMQTPPSQPEEFVINVAATRAVIDAVAAAGRDVLTEPEAKAVLAAAGVPVVPAQVARTPQEAAAAQVAIGGPVALKLLSPDIAHKSDVGGVRLDLRSPGLVEAAARSMLERVRTLRPQARVDGFSVQAMVRRPGAHELVVGLEDDRTFGPVVVFGHGGVAVERRADRALGLPPLNMHLAHTLMRGTRVIRLLEGYRDRPPADLDAVALTLIKVAQIAVELPEIVMLDVNPLLADTLGVVALDARIRIDLARRDTDRLAIRPYPRELESEDTLPDGTRFLLRPIRPEDEPAIAAWFLTLDPEDVRLRFFAPMKSLPHTLAARLTQIDYDRQMALVAMATGEEGAGRLLGVVRLAIDSSNTSGEFAITVASRIKRRRLGRLLMKRIIDYGRRRGLQQIVGLVLRENSAMLALCQELGFVPAPSSEDPSVLRMILKLA